MQVSCFVSGSDLAKLRNGGTRDCTEEVEYYMIPPTLGGEPIRLMIIVKSSCDHWSTPIIAKNNNLESINYK